MQLKMNGHVKKIPELFLCDGDIHKNRSLHSKWSVYKCSFLFTLKCQLAEAHSHLYHLLKLLLWDFFLILN